MAKAGTLIRGAAPQAGDWSLERDDGALHPVLPGVVVPGPARRNDDRPALHEMWETHADGPIGQGWFWAMAKIFGG